MQDVTAQIDTSKYQLLETEKYRIRLEEKYRYEIKSQFKEKPESNSKYVKFLNSPLGLWILSSAFISLISFVWNQRKQANEKKSRDSEKRNKLKIELKYRLSEFNKNVKIFEKKELKFKQPSIMLNPIFSTNCNPIYPEFQNRHFESVLMEARFYSDDKLLSFFEKIHEVLFCFSLDMEELDKAIKEGDESKFNKIFINQFYPRIEILDENIDKIVNQLN